MKELSNWGRWGDRDELGAANLITPAKRKQALALAREGRAISLAHDVPQEKAADTPTFLDRAVVTVSPAVEKGRSVRGLLLRDVVRDRKSTRLNSSHSQISYAVFC